MSEQQEGQQEQAPVVAAGKAGSSGGSSWLSGGGVLGFSLASEAGLGSVLSQKAQAVTGVLWDVKGKVERKVEESRAAMQAEYDRHQKRADQLEVVSSGRAPWSVDDLPDLEPVLKQRVLLMLEDDATFLTMPRDHEAKAWDHQGMLPHCKAALDLLPALRDARFRLVPTKVRDEVFWRNFFAHVDVAKDDALANLERELAHAVQAPLASQQDKHDEGGRQADAPAAKDHNDDQAELDGVAVGLEDVDDGQLDAVLKQELGSDFGDLDQDAEELERALQEELSLLEGDDPKS